MAKKQFIATISMQDPKNLKPLIYKAEFDSTFTSIETASPAICMLQMNLNKGDDYELVTVRTIDDNKFTPINYESFKADLKRLSDVLGFEITIGREIDLPHVENREKHIGFFNDICKVFDKSADIYMDITYGTKATPVAEFASLVYAEKVADCAIKQVIYGKYAYKGNEGELYNLRCLYELSQLIHSYSYLENVDINKMLSAFGGNSDV